MSIRNLATLDRTVFQPLGRILQEAFADGIDCDVPIAPNKALICKTDNLLINSVLDTKDVSINSRDYTQVTGNIFACRCKPNATGDGDLFMYGFESSPRFADGVGGLGLSCYIAEADLKGTTGDITGILRCFEGKLESTSGSQRTVADAAVFHAMNALHGTLTDGPYVLKVDTHGGNVAWKGLMDLPDVSGIAQYRDAGYTPGNADGKIFIYIGDNLLYIPAYDTMADA